jgi:NitT/TauT family transport system substrate-binding protein
MTYRSENVSRRGALRLGALSLGSLASLCSSAAGQDAKVRIATIADPSAIEVFVARDQHFFENAKLSVDIATLTAVTATEDAVYDDDAAIGYGDCAHIAVAQKKNLKPIILWPCTGSRQTAGLVVSHDSPIKFARDLNGKTIAIGSLDSVSQIATRAWIDQNGGDSKTVQFVAFTGLTATKAALVSGGVAAVTAPTAAFATIGRSIGEPLASLGSGRDVATSAWFTTEDWFNSHRDEAERFSGAMKQAADWANKNKDKLTNLMTTYSKVSPAVAQSLRVRFAVDNSVMLYQPVFDTALKYGLLNQSVSTASLLAPARI